MGARARVNGAPIVKFGLRQFLIFDADDTLWENNIYFEEAFDHFCSYLAHSSLSPGQVRAVLDEIELVNAALYGYGAKNFGRNLVVCFQRLVQRDISDQDLDAVREFAHAILNRPIELIEGVRETVAELSTRHDLTLFTKGDREEQRLKIDRSGLAPYFRHTAIVREKNESAYRELVRERNLEHERVWMIGNSPKSDINPALAVGLNAVYVPHLRTWGLEREAIPEDHPRLVRVEKISEMTELF